MSDSQSQPLPIVWGAKAIGETINRTERQTFHMLQRGNIAGAFKAGRLYGLRLDVFKAETAPRRLKQQEASDAAA